MAKSCFLELLGRLIQHLVPTFARNHLKQTRKQQSQKIANSNLSPQEYVQSAKIRQKLDGNYVKSMNRQEGTVPTKPEVLCKMRENSLKNRAHNMQIGEEY